MALTPASLICVKDGESLPSEVLDQLNCIPHHFHNPSRADFDAILQIADMSDGQAQSKDSFWVSFDSTYDQDQALALVARQRFIGCHIVAHNPKRVVRMHLGI